MKTIEEKTFDLLEATNLNWSVSKENLISEATQRKTGSSGIFREDNGLWLGTVGEDYTPLQNSELANILLSSIDGLGFEEELRGGQLKNGKKVYLQAKLQDEFIGNSEIKRYITNLNSHDGSTSVGFGTSNTVVICSNTFYRALGEIDKFRHTTNLKARVELTAQKLNETLRSEEQLMLSFKKMADMPLSDEPIQMILDKLFKVEKETEVSKLSTQKVNKVAEFSESVRTSIGQQGATIWGLFNGITHFANHVMAPKDITKKMDYIMLSGGVSFMNKGFEILNAYTSEHLPVHHYMEANN